MVGVVLTNLGTFLIMVCCIFLIWRKTRQSVMPEQQRSVRINRQVGRVLLIQALLPLILQTIPSTLLILSVVIGQNVSFISSFLNAQTWTSCLYPISTMAIIGHYRREIKKLVLSLRNNPNSISSMYPTTAPWNEQMMSNLYYVCIFLEFPFDLITFLSLLYYLFSFSIQSLSLFPKSYSNK
jgi:hypothetical protein